jgi:GDPmannose 4,6-dehydratase
LGNLEASRDWGFAGDYVDAMWRMLQADEPDDYVIATGETHSVRQFCELAFQIAERPVEWRGAGVAEVAVDRAGSEVVRIDPRYFRPAEVDCLHGDASYARQKLRWKPTVSFPELVKLMVEADWQMEIGGAHAARQSSGGK